MWFTIAAAVASHCVDLTYTYLYIVIVIIIMYIYIFIHMSMLSMYTNMCIHIYIIYPCSL